MMNSCGYYIDHYARASNDLDRLSHTEEHFIDLACTNATRTQSLLEIYPICQEFGAIDPQDWYTG